MMSEGDVAKERILRGTDIFEFYDWAMAKHRYEKKKNSKPEKEDGG